MLGKCKKISDMKLQWMLWVLLMMVLVMVNGTDELGEKVLMNDCDPELDDEWTMRVKATRFLERFKQEHLNPKWFLRGLSCVETLFWRNPAKFAVPFVTWVVDGGDLEYGLWILELMASKQCLVNDAAYHMGLILSDPTIGRYEEAIMYLSVPGEEQNSRNLYKKALALEKLGMYKWAWVTMMEAHRTKRTSIVDSNALERWQKYYLHLGASKQTLSWYAPLVNQRLVSAAHAIREMEHRINPIFVVGLPRSGTTLLDRILSAHPRIISSGEAFELDTEIVPDATCFQNKKTNQLDCSYFGKLAQFFQESKYDPLAYERKRKRLINAILRTRVLPTDLSKPGIRFIIDKNPENWRSIPVIKAMLPSAKVILIERDLMDTAISLAMNDFDSRYLYYTHNVEDIAHHLNVYLETITLYKELSQNHKWWHHVKYEDLVKQPLQTLQSVFQYLGLESGDLKKLVHTFPNYKQNRGMVTTVSKFQVREGLNQKSMHRSANFRPYLPESWIKIEGKKRI